MKILISLMFLTSVNAAAATKSNFDRRAAEKIMRKNLKKFEKCYSNELKKDPAYREGVVLSWDITISGEVQNLAVTNSTTVNPRLHVCLLDTLQTLKFNVAKEGTEGHMIYPMILSKNNCEN